MKSFILKVILLCFLIFSCTKNKLPNRKDYTLEDKLKFTNTILKFYVDDSLVCNHLSNKLDWTSFESGFYSEEGLLLEKYAVDMKIEDIESQMGSFILNDNYNEFFPNYRLFEEDIESRSDSIFNLKNNLYYTTLPIFTDNGKFAFVGFSVISSLLSGYGEIIVFERKNNKWIEIERKQIWMH
ncbi:hypothetical protein SAMN05421741_10934 [Paenimyroides ummariense]|uniref:Uncharacterized protein n=1 Tax=Paenimyroides ummariense TaxID=913024 RepID=A0A1I5B250_9FLAO|nr:hypothetical protein SAMN05421741_10934 [Paenimyroides ummariense]